MAIMNFLTFTNDKLHTPFAREYNFTIGSIELADQLDITLIKEKLLQEEPILLDKYKGLGHDGSTSLGIDSVTAKHQFFNVLHYDFMKPAIPIIRTCYEEYMKFLNLPVEKIYGAGWFNVMRKGQRITRHHHNEGVYCYLSSHLTISANNTNTYYYNNVGKEHYAEPNVSGKLTFFPSWLDHATDEVVDDQERITIAMDFVNEIGYKEDIYDGNKSHWTEITKEKE